MLEPVGSTEDFELGRYLGGQFSIFYCQVGKKNLLNIVCSCVCTLKLHDMRKKHKVLLEKCQF